LGFVRCMHSLVSRINCPTCTYTPPLPHHDWFLYHLRHISGDATRACYTARMKFERQCGFTPYLYGWFHTKCGDDNKHAPAWRQEDVAGMLYIIRCPRFPDALDFYDLWCRCVEWLCYTPDASVRETLDNILLNLVSTNRVKYTLFDYIFNVNSIAQHLFTECTCEARTMLNEAQTVLSTHPYLERFLLAVGVQEAWLPLLYHPPVLNLLLKRLVVPDLTFCVIMGNLNQVCQLAAIQQTKQGKKLLLHNLMAVLHTLVKWLWQQDEYLQSAAFQISVCRGWFYMYNAVELLRVLETRQHEFASLPTPPYPQLSSTHPSAPELDAVEGQARELISIQSS
jgi:hypothetical protein